MQPSVCCVASSAASASVSAAPALDDAARASASSAAFSCVTSALWSAGAPLSAWMDATWPGGRCASATVWCMGKRRRQGAHQRVQRLHGGRCWW